MEINASKYEGDMQNSKPHGKGKYTFVNGTVYEGGFKDGMFHGKGVLHIPDKGRYEGQWVDGEAQEGQYYFADGLAFEGDDWAYCKDDDRRFYSEILHGINPAGQSKIQGVGIPQRIPKGAHDVGDGYFDPRDGKIHDYEGVVLREPDDNELQLIKQSKLRVGVEE